MKATNEAHQAVEAPPSHPAAPFTRPILVSAVLFMLITGIGYPLLTTASAQVLFAHQARGSLIERQGRAVGSEVVGQSFTRAEYFHGRPSVTSGPDPADPSKTVEQPYHGGLSAASNQGVLSRTLTEAVAERTARYRQDNALARDVQVPVDAVTASASGLDPDISLAK